MESSFVDVGGADLYFERAGTGPAVVMVPPALLDVRMWDPQLEPLARTHTVIRYDMRGYGRSDPPDGSSYRHCDDLRELLSALDVERAVFVGNSLSGAVLVDFALCYPDMVRGLIFSSAGPIAGWDWVHGFPVGPAVKIGAREGIAAFREAFLGLPLVASAMEKPDAASLLRSMVDDYSGWHFENHDPSEFAFPDGVDRLREITAPALVIIGGHDAPDIQLIGEKLAADLPNGEKHIIEHVGHVPNIEDPDTFNRLTTDFLASLAR